MVQLLTFSNTNGAKTLFWPRLLIRFPPFPVTQKRRPFYSRAAFSVRLTVHFFVVYHVSLCQALQRTQLAHWRRPAVSDCFLSDFPKPDLANGVKTLGAQGSMVRERPIYKNCLCWQRSSVRSPHTRLQASGNEAPAADARPWARRGNPASVRGPVPSSWTGGLERRPRPAGGGTGRLSGPAWGNNNFS